MGKDDIIGVDTKELRVLGTRIPIWLIAVIIVVVVFTGGLGTGFKLKDLNPARWFEPGEEGNFVGGVAFTIDESDWQANIAAAPTSPTFALYYTKPGAASVGKPVAAAGSTISVDGSGYVWLDLYGGTDFYMIPDYNVMKASNPKLTQLVIEDYDGDGTLDYLAQFDVANVGVTGQGVNPTFDIAFPLLDQDTTSLAISAPADQTGLGSTEQVVTATHTLSGVTADDGFIITEIWYTTNSSSEGTDLDFESLTISGGWTVKMINGASMSLISKVNDPIGEENAYYNAWYIEADDDNDPLASSGLMVYRETDAVDELDLKVNMRWTGSHQVTVTCNVKYITPGGTKATLTDTLTLNDA